MVWDLRAQEHVSAPYLIGSPAPPHRLVLRKRLTDLFDRAAAVTYVVAPAGSGKTVLAAEWVRGAAPSGHAACWLSVADHQELGPALVVALGHPDEAADVVRQERDHRRRAELAVDALRAGLAAGLSPAAIVVDDAHELSLAGIELLDRVLHDVPEAVRLVLLSRRDLSLPLVPLQLAGRLVTIRAGQLGFQDDEAADLVMSHAPRATTDDVTQLLEHTQGWAAALILAARTLDAAEDKQTAHLMMRSTEQPVLDYLLGESLEVLSDDTRQVLLSICHEAEVTPESAIALSGHLDAGDRLTDLAREGLLVTAYPDGAGGGLVWRLHPLLLEALSRMATLDTSDAHVRGAAYARADGNPVAALRHAVLSDDEDLLATLLLDLAPDLLAMGQVDAIDDGLRHLSPAYRSAHPQLLGIEALCRTQTDIGEALSLLAKAETAEAAATAGGGSEDDPADQLLVADLARLRLWRARLGWADLNTAVVAAREVIASPGGSTLSATRTCTTLLELANAESWQGDLETALQRTREALVMAQSLGYPRLRVAALAQCALLEAVQGATQAVRAHASECLQLAVEDDSDDTDTCRAHLALAWAELQALELTSAEADLRRSRTSAASFDPLVVVVDAVLGARLLIEEGRLQEAERVLAGPLAVPTPLPSFALALVSTAKAQLAAATGDDVALDEEIDRLFQAGCHTEGRLFAAIRSAYDGRLAEAIADLDELAASPSPWLVLRSSVETVRLALRFPAGDVDAARVALPHLLTTVATHRHLYVLTAALRTGDFLESLRLEKQRTDAHPYAAEALAAMQSYELAYPERQRPLLDSSTSTTPIPPDLRSPAPDDPPAETLLAHLTPREAEVFEQLALGGSYSDIARALFVTENTVKTHLASIYRKLGVERRAEALQVGRDQGLLVVPARRQ